MTTSETRSVASSVARASALLASGTLVSRILGFVRTWLLLQAIGAVGFGANAYGTATAVPNSIYAIVAQGLLNAVLVPQTVRAASHADGGKAYINKLVTVGLVVFAGVTLIATVFAPDLMHLFGLRGTQATLATTFAYWSLPQIFFLGSYTLLGEVLNARKSFGPFTWAPVLNNVVSIVLVIAFIGVYGANNGHNRTSGHWDPAMIALLAGGATLGIAVQGVMLVFFWRHVGLRFRPDFRWGGVGLGVAGKAAGWTFAMLVLTQIAGLIQTNVSNTVARTQYASTYTLSTAWLVFMLPHSIIAVSIVTAYYTRMSEHAHHGDMNSFRRDFSAAVRSMLLFTTLASAALIVVAFPFSYAITLNAAYLQVGQVLVAYLVALVPYGILFVTQRAFYSLEDTVTPFFFTLAQVVIVIGGVVACLGLPAPVRGFGIAGVVSLATCAQALIAVLLLRRRIHHLDGRRMLASLWRYVAAAVIAAIAGFGVLAGLGGDIAHGFAMSGFLPAVGSSIVVCVVMGFVYVIALIVLGSRDVRDVGLPVIARFARRGR